MAQALASSAFLLAACAALVPPASAQVAPGYQDAAVSVAPGGAFIGGFDVLPGGDYLLFDGTAVVEVSAANGAVLRTLYTPPASVYGAFLTLDPAATVVYFGESTHGSILEIDLTSLAVRKVGVASLPFDLAFAPGGDAYLSWSPGFGQGSFVSRLDLATGALDDVLSSPEASSPVVFSAAGDLWFTTPDSSSWPPPPDTTEVYRLAAVEVQAGIGPGVKTPADATLVGVVDGAYGLAVDGAGDLFVTDPNYHMVTELDAETGAERVLWDSTDMEGLTYARFVPGTQGVFEGYQPATGGSLVMLETDYWSYNNARTLTPRRPVLSATPGPVAPGAPFQVDLDGGVPAGRGLLFLTGGLLGAETPVGNGTWPAPLFFGLDFGAGWYGLRPVTLDAAGQWSAGGTNPGLGGLTLGLQVLVGPTLGGPYYGTSTPATLVLQ